MAEQLPVIRTLATLPLLMLAASCATVPQESGPDPKLAEALVGKIAEAPRQCIPLEVARGGQVFRDAILYNAGRGRSYVNSTPGCRAFSSDPIFVVTPTGNQLCRGDVVRLVDRVGGTPGPVCILGDFTPYRTPR